MPLVRFEVKSEYRLGDPELYRGPGKKEDSKALLDGVAVAGLVGILRQLGDLAEFAADVFHDLHEQVLTTSARGHKVMDRIQRIEAVLPSVEKAVQGQRSHIHFAYVAGADWHPNIRITESQFLGSDLPQFIMDSYEECHEPPRLHLLDKFDSAGPGACLKRYSDPSYFKRVCVPLELMKMERTTREKKVNRCKRHSSRHRHRHGEIQHVMSISQHNTRTRLASLGSDGHSFSSENTLAYEPRPKHEIVNESASSDSKTMLNHVEQDSDARTLSALHDELDYGLSISKLEINHSDPSACGPLTESSGGADDNLLQDPMQEKSVSGSPSVTWDEKTEILKPENPGAFDDTTVEQVEHSAPLPACFETPNIDNELNKIERTVDQGDVLFDIANATSSFSGGNHFDDVNSETDNYLDALNTMESETETDSEYQTKREVKSLPNDNFQALDTENGIAQEIASPTAYSSGSGTPVASHNSLELCTSLELHNVVPSDSSIFVKSTHMHGLAPDSDNATDKGISENSVLDMAKMNNLELSEDLSPELSTTTSPEKLYNGITGNTPMMHGSSNVSPRMPAINFWTNGGLLGVEPSKPPDFSFPSISSSTNTASSDITGLNFFSYATTHKLHFDESAAKSDTLDMPSVSIAKNPHSVEDMDVSSTTGSSIYQRRTNHFVMHDDLSVNQSSQKSLPAHSVTNFQKYQDGLTIKTSAPKDRSEIEEIKDFVPGGELHMCDVESETTEARQTSASISSSISDLTQRFLSNNLQRKTSETHADISKQSGMTGSNPRKLHENSIQNRKEEGYVELVSEASYTQKAPDKIEKELSGKSVPSFPGYSEQSSPPLEHMKISSHPMNWFETSKLKLDFSNHNLYESCEDSIFPSFQLLPGPAVPLKNDGSDSDDDTFCRSCPYTSEEDLLSPRSDSNSELWEQDEREVNEDHGISDESHTNSPSAAHTSSHTPNSTKRFMRLDDDDGISFQSSQTVDLPGLDMVESQNSGRKETFGPFSIDTEGQSQNEPPLSLPLPPVQWRITKPDFTSIEDTSSVITELDYQFDGVHSQRFIGEQHKEQNIPTPLQITESMVNPSIKQHDEQKPNGQKEAKRGAQDKKPDEKEDFLQQIRNKSFNLRRTVTPKPNAVSQPATNVNVAAILEKASAIRQACADSDDVGDDDNWSDD